MSRFKQYGGRDRSAKDNIVSHEHTNKNNTNTSDKIGLNNSKIAVQSDVDLSCNSILRIDTLYFIDGTYQNTGILDDGFTGPTGWTGPRKEIKGTTGNTGIKGPTGFADE